MLSKTTLLLLWASYAQASQEPHNIPDKSAPELSLFAQIIKNNSTRPQPNILNDRQAIAFNEWQQELAIMLYY